MHHLIHKSKKSYFVITVTRWCIWIFRSNLSKKNVYL